MTEPNPIDRHIGRRAAVRRQSLGLPPGDVARGLGLDEAGLEDLERGMRRIAARQLWTWSGLLRVPVAYFFTAQDEAPQAFAHMIFVPDPDLDWPEEADPTAVH